MSFRSLAFLSALLLLTVRGSAELKWDRPVQQFQRTPADGEIEARFAFWNVGAAPVTIRTLRSSCGCTTARLERKTYASGEADPPHSPTPVRVLTVSGAADAKANS